MKWKEAERLVVISLMCLLSGIFLQFTFHPNQVDGLDEPLLPPYLSDTSTWVDSVFNQLSLEEKVAQSVFAAVYPRKGEPEKERLIKLIEKEKIGGVIFFQGTPSQVSSWSKAFQKVSEIPLLVAIDGEWGLDMRLDSTIQYPRQMMLGAIQDNELIYQMGQDIARQLKHIGVHINFAPVADINNNQHNPVINSRSFGELRENVSLKSNAYARGMQSENVIAVAKHFPGHGDTYQDSHKALPLLKFDYKRLDSLELYPFRYLISQGVGGVMMAHLNVLAIDSTPNLPTSLSGLAIDSLLKKEMGFKGLVFTDAMNMKGVSGFYGPVQANLMAYKAGNDVLLMPHEIRKSINKIKRSVWWNDISEEQVNATVKRILLAKDWTVRKDSLGAYNYDSLHHKEYYLNKKKLIEAAVTVVENKDSLLPLRNYDTLKALALSFGPTDGNVFQQRLKSYDDVDIIDVNQHSFIEVLKVLDKYNLVILSLHTDDYRASRKYGFSSIDIDKIQQIIKRKATLLVSFAEPYFLNHIENLKECKAIVIANHKDSLCQHTVAQSLFGAYPMSGKLPVSLEGSFPAGTGFSIKSLSVFQYTSVYEAGLNSDSLKIIDSIVTGAIQQDAMPGCQVFAARNGKVFFQKNYGYQTYRKKSAVNNETVYDIASITKIAGALPIIMKLAEDNHINIENPLSEYLSELDTTNKKDIIIKDILMHQAGLYPWVPFYRSMIEPLHPNQDLFRTRYSWKYPLQVGKHVFMNKHTHYKDGYVNIVKDSAHTLQLSMNRFIGSEWRDSIFYTTLQSKVQEPGNYKYSDLGFILFYYMVQEQTGKTLEFLADSIIYSQIGANTLGYHPLSKMPIEQVAPTEDDIYFRRELVHGHVHDPAAAMMGGASGHAGLFSNANDLAKLMQLYLNGGEYASKSIFNAKTIQEYTIANNIENGNRRAIGFDKPNPDTSSVSPCSKNTPLSAFGHTGFTGTATWADPETGIVYVFLSNRVFPDAVENKLAHLDVRTNIQKALYNAMK